MTSRCVQNLRLLAAFISEITVCRHRCWKTYFVIKLEIVSTLAACSFVDSSFHGKVLATAIVGLNRWVDLWSLIKFCIPQSEIIDLEFGRKVKKTRKLENGFLTPISQEPEVISTSGHLCQMVLDKVSDYAEYYFRSYSSLPCSHGQKFWFRNFDPPYL